MRRIFLSAFAMIGGLAVAADLHLAGDSTLETREASCGIQSWGEKLRSRLKDGNGMRNCAVSGTSTVTFRKTWDAKLIGNVKAGDFVLIQFGHNDCWHSDLKALKPGEKDRFCTPDQYKANLKAYIAEVCAKKATPVLLSPTPQRSFNKKGEWAGASKQHKPYFEKLAELAREEKVDFLDMTAFGGAVLGTMGPEASKELFFAKFDGKDNVHPSESGARIFAELFLVNARIRKLPVADLFK